MGSGRSVIAGCAVCLLVLCATLAAVLFPQRNAAFIFPDSVHQLSVADNVFRDHGLATSILEYPEHYRFGTVPAPQTVWPRPKRAVESAP
jgi:hypothetical protein